MELSWRPIRDPGETSQMEYNVESAFLQCGDTNRTRASKGKLEKGMMMTTGIRFIIEQIWHNLMPHGYFLYYKNKQNKRPIEKSIHQCESSLLFYRDIFRKWLFDEILIIQSTNRF